MAVLATKTALTMVATMAAIAVAVATVTATAVGGKDNSGDSDCRQHRQQSLKNGSKDMVAVSTATETAAAGAARTSAGPPTATLGVGADGITFATAEGTAMTALGTTTSVANAARTAWRFGRGVAHIVQYLPPLLKEAHAPHSQSEVEEEEAMMGGLCMLVVRVVCAGCAFAVRPCCFVRLTCMSAQKIGKSRHIGDRRRGLFKTN
jgi:hypothetical protein